MKTSHFIDEVSRFRGLGLRVVVNDEIISIKNSFDVYVLVIDVDEICSIDTRLRGFRDLSNDDKIGLYALCNRYVMNDVSDRNSSLKYALEHKWLNYMGKTFMNYQESVGIVTVDVIIRRSGFKYLLTIEEWEKYTGRTMVELLKEFNPVSEDVFCKLYDEEGWKENV